MDAKRAREVLGRHGWDAGGLGVATFESGDVTLDFDFNPSDDDPGIWGLLISGPDGGCQLWIHHGGQGAKVLDALVGVQDSITPANFRDKVRGLLAVAKKIEVQLDEDGDPVELVDE